MKLKIAVDCLLTLLLLLLMAFPLTGQFVHEWLGVAMLLLFTLHHFLNRQWATNLLRGKYNYLRVLQTAVDIMLLVAMLILMFSGLSLARYTLPSGLAFMSAAVARKLHLVVSHWAFLLMSVHLGLHWQIFAAKLSTAAASALPRLFAGLLGAWGLWAFCRRQIWLYLFGVAEFFIFDEQRDGLLFFGDYLAIMALFAGLAYGVIRLCRMCLGKNKKNGG